jgi:hypothetical protein
MPIIDHYCFDLLPAVWHRDGQVTRGFTAFAQQQIRRFPEGSVAEVLLIGDAVQHYWTKESPIDMVVRADPRVASEVVEQAERASGTIQWLGHPVEFFAADRRHDADAIAARFGPTYSLNRQVWHGVVPYDTEELLRPTGLVARIAWQQYRMARLKDLESYEWRVEKEAFRQQGPAARFRTMAEMRFRIAAHRATVDPLYIKLSRDDWRHAHELEQRIAEVDEMPDSPLPTNLLRGLAQQARWARLMEEFADIDERQRKMESLGVK